MKNFRSKTFHITIYIFLKNSNKSKTLRLNFEIIQMISFHIKTVPNPPTTYGSDREFCRVSLAIAILPSLVC